MRRERVAIAQPSRCRASERSGASSASCRRHSGGIDIDAVVRASKRAAQRRCGRRARVDARDCEQRIANAVRRSRMPRAPRDVTDTASPAPSRLAPRLALDQALHRRLELALAQQLHRRTVESAAALPCRRRQSASMNSAAHRPAQIQHDRRLLRRARNFTAASIARCGSRAQVKRDRERARQRMRIEILRVVRAGVRLSATTAMRRARASVRAARRRRDVARPLQIALHLIFGIVRARGQQTFRDRSRHRSVRAGRQRAACRACAATSVAASKLLVRDQRAQRVAERETDERCLRSAAPGPAARPAPAGGSRQRSTKSTCSAVSGIVGQRRERAHCFHSTCSWS